MYPYQQPSNHTGRGLGAKYLPNVSGKHAEPPTAVRHTFMLTTLEMSKIVALVPNCTVNASSEVPAARIKAALLPVTGKYAESVLSSPEIKNILLYFFLI